MLFGRRRSVAGPPPPGDTQPSWIRFFVAAILVAEACTVGLTPVVKDGLPALTRARRAHVDQHCVRADTLRAANFKLVQAQSALGWACRPPVLAHRHQSRPRAAERGSWPQPNQSGPHHGKLARHAPPCRNPNCQDRARLGNSVSHPGLRYTNTARKSAGGVRQNSQNRASAGRYRW